MKKSAKRKNVSKKGYRFSGKAISIAQPWASAIVFAGKDIENRSWQTHYRGPVAIHASATFYEDLLDLKRAQVRGGPRKPLIDWIKKGQKRYKLYADEQEIVQSHIVAIAMLHDCTQRRKSIWHAPDSWGWSLQGVIPIKPIPKKGALGLWDCRFTYQPLALRG